MSETRQIRIFLDGLSCAGCVRRAETALTALDGVTRAEVNLANATARIEAANTVSINDIAEALDAAGYKMRTAVTVLAIDKMSCASCVGRVESALAAQPGVIEARVNLASESARVVHAEGVTRPGDLIEAAQAAGYPATVADAGETRTAAARKTDEAHDMARRTALAAALALPVFVLEMGGHVVPALHHLIADTVGMQASWVLQFVLTTLVLAGPGRGFYRTGIPALLRGAPDMNSLVALGTGAAYGYSVVATFALGCFRTRCARSISRRRR